MNTDPSDRLRLLVFSAVILSIAILLPSCHRSKPPGAKRYVFTGRVVSVDSPAQSALIDGDAVPGFMDAMAMPYKVKPASALSRLSPGDSIAGEVVVVQPEDNNAAPDYWIENLKVTGQGKTPPPASASDAVRRIPAPGDDVPDFQFTNQDGKRISLRHYRGKVLLLTFIYTRCPFADFCPRMSANFSAINKHLAGNPVLTGVDLLTISFDPEHDTPKVLRDYGFRVSHTHDPGLFDRWQFAAPRVTDLAEIADFFGLIQKPEGGMITHNLSTTVIGPDGKIMKWYHGGDWQVSDLMKDAGDARASKR